MIKSFMLMFAEAMRLDSIPHRTLALAFAASLALISGVSALAEEAVPGPDAGVGVRSATDREDMVPEPRWPGLEMLPEGVEPPPWKAFGRDQKIDSLTRISIELGISGKMPIINHAGSGENAPKFDDLIGLCPGISVEAGYALAPSLSLGVTFHALFMMGQSLENQGPEGRGHLKLGDNDLFGFTADFKIRLPLSGTSRMLRFSRAEAPTGVCLLTRFSAGVVVFDSWNAEWWPEGEWWEEAGIPGERFDIQYWSDSVNLMALFSMGIEYRLANLSFKLEFGTVSLGAPSPSSDPVWSASSKAGNLVAAFFQMTLGVHF